MNKYREAVARNTSEDGWTTIDGPFEIKASVLLNALDEMSFRMALGQNNDLEIAMFAFLRRGLKMVD